MTDHPITPPPELVHEWARSSPIEYSDESWAYELFIAHQAAQWGADQELEACIEWITERDWTWTSAQLRAARRPKPPNKKQRGLIALEATKLKEDDPLLYQEILNAIEELPND